MEKHMNVFISSTSRDLEKYRNAVTNVILRLGLHPIIMEAFNPTDRNAIELCYSKVQEAQIFIGIYAYRYGHVPNAGANYRLPNGTEAQCDGKTSITHLEYQWAYERNLPLLLFVVSENDANGNSLAWPTAFMEDEPGKSRLKEFKASIMSSHVVGFFHSPDNLASQVATGLLTEFVKQQQYPSIQINDEEIVPVSGSRLGDISSYFKNRDSERLEIKQQISHPDTRILSVIGRGGIGKTSLVSKALNELQEDSKFRDVRKRLDGIIYLSTRTNGISLERIFIDFSNLLTAADRDDLLIIWTSPELSIQEKINNLVDKSKQGFYVLVLDNMEDTLNDEGRITNEELHSFIETCLRSKNSFRILTTSRVPISFSKELLRFDHRVLVNDGLSDSDAVKMLRELDPHGEYGLRDADEELLLDIVDKVCGVPRALEAIASILANDPLLGLEDLVIQDTLFNNDEFVDELVNEHYRRLDQTSKYVLQAIAIYDRPVTIDAIGYLLESIVESNNLSSILVRLIKIHAVRFDRSLKLFSLHPIDQAHIYSQIPRAGTLFNKPFAELRAAAFYASKPVILEACQTLEDLEARLFQFDHLVRGEDFTGATRLYIELAKQFLLRRGYAMRVIAMGEQLSDIADRQPFHNIVMAVLGKAYSNLGNYEQAEQCLVVAIKATTNDNKLMIAEILGDLGQVYRALGEYDQSKRALSKGLDALVGLNINDNEVHNLIIEIQRNLGNLLRNEYDCNMSLEIFEQSVLQCKRHNDRYNLGLSLGSLSRTQRDIGQLDSAAINCNAALQIAVELSDVRAECLWKGCLGNINTLLGNSAIGKQNLSEALELAYSIKDKRYIYQWSLGMGINYYATNNLTEAIDHLNEARAVAADVGSKVFQLNSAFWLGQVYIRMGDVSSAEKALSQSYSDYRIAVCIAITNYLANKIEYVHKYANEALNMIDGILNKCPRQYEVRFFKAVSLALLALISSGTDQQDYRQHSIEEVNQALEITSHKGVIALVLPLFEKASSLAQREFLEDIVYSLSSKMLN